MKKYARFMKKHIFKIVILLIIFLLAFLSLLYFLLNVNKYQKKEDILEPEQKREILLSSPNLKGLLSLEETLQKRRSVREYKKEPLSLKEVSQILWASQGITEGDHRTVPSAGALYPIEIYFVVDNVELLQKGLYHYVPKDHKLILISEGDFNEKLSNAALGQKWVKEAAVNLIITAVPERTTQKYGERGVQYVWMEAGHSSQNVYLQAVSLSLGTVTVGGFIEEDVKEVLNLPEDTIPLYIMPIGKK